MEDLDAWMVRRFLEEASAWDKLIEAPSGDELLQQWDAAGGVSQETPDPATFASRTRKGKKKVTSQFQ